MTLTINKIEILVVFENFNKMIWVHTNNLYTCKISKTEPHPILRCFMELKIIYSNSLWRNIGVVASYGLLSNSERSLYVDTLSMSDLENHSVIELGLLLTSNPIASFRKGLRVWKNMHFKSFLTTISVYDLVLYVAYYFIRNFSFIFVWLRMFFIGFKNNNLSILY